MGLKLVDLLRWSKQIPLKNSDGSPIEKDGKPIVVWLRIIGDQDLENAYKGARAASARQRATLRDKTSEEYLSGIAALEEADATVCRSIITASKSREFNSLAYANVERPNLPKIEEVAVDADAPTLEEQEKFDRLVDETNVEYLKALDDYVDQKMAELNSELDSKSIEELRQEAIVALIDVQALEVFIKELDYQKAYRAVYLDKYFKEPAFDNVDEFKQFKLRDFIISEYSALELAPDDIKN